MKKIIFVILALFLLVSIGMPSDKPAEVKKDVVAEKKTLTESDWKSINETASKLDSDGKFEEARIAYMEYVKLGEAVQNEYSVSRIAWGYQNAAYCIIKMYKLDNKVDLKPALELLEKAVAAETNDADCLKCINSNLSFVKEGLGIKNTVEPKMASTPEVKKGIKKIEPITKEVKKEDKKK